MKQILLKLSPEIKLLLKKTNSSPKILFDKNIFRVDNRDFSFVIKDLPWSIESIVSKDKHKWHKSCQVKRIMIVGNFNKSDFNEIEKEQITENESNLIIEKIKQLQKIEKNYNY